MKISRVLHLRCSGSFGPGGRGLLLRAEDLIKSNSSKMKQKINLLLIGLGRKPIIGVNRSLENRWTGSA